MSSFEATFRIGIIAIAGALLMIYMMRAIWEIEQDIQDEKRVKVRWTLLFNRTYGKCKRRERERGE